MRTGGSAKPSKAGNHSQRFFRAIQFDTEVGTGEFLIVTGEKNLERIADHATNIAEDVIYMVTGSEVRHSTVGKSGSAHHHFAVQTAQARAPVLLKLR